MATMPRDPVESERGLPKPGRDGALIEEATAYTNDELRDRIDVLLAEELRRLHTEVVAERRDELFQQAEKLASLGVLARGLAHELNNIFSGVIAHCDFALTSGDDETTQRALEVAVSSSQRGALIVKNLQQFVKRRCGSSAPTDIAELIHQLHALIAPTLKASQLRWSEELLEGVVLCVDAAAIHQALLNLMTNAMQASSPGQCVVVGLRAVGEFFEIAVRDEGAGIPIAHLEHIFEPFFSTKGVYAKTSHERHLQGTGLGLSVVFAVAKQHGGRVEVESEEGAGACFRVYLPRGDNG